jgi:protein SMG7
VISTYVNDDLLCVYYYFRAMAVRQAFKNIEDILEKFLRKVYERWHTAQGDDDEDRDGETGLEELRRDFLVIIAILYRRTG